MSARRRGVRRSFIRAIPRASNVDARVSALLDASDDVRPVVLSGRRPAGGSAVRGGREARGRFMRAFLRASGLDARVLVLWDASNVGG
jgi:hypothetical protein